MRSIVTRQVGLAATLVGVLLCYGGFVGSRMLAGDEPPATATAGDLPGPPQLGAAVADDAPEPFLPPRVPLDAPGRATAGKPAPGGMPRFDNGNVTTLPGRPFAGDEVNVRDLLGEQREHTVTVEWVGPTQVKVGQPFVYELVVRNLASYPVTGVVIRDFFHEAIKIVAVEPKGQPTDDGMQWLIGEMQPREETRIRMQMVAMSRGDVARRAEVTATTPAISRFRVSEPQLAVKQVSPDKVMVGDPVTVTIAVSNPGDGPADNVVVRSTLSEGLTHEKGNQFAYELGSLAAGETRTIQVVCASVAGGEQQIHSVATAEGGLQAEALSKTQVTEAKLSLTLDGPRLRYLERSATYRIAVQNPGDAPANNVKLVSAIPPGFKYMKATEGGRHDFTTQTITWFIGTIPPGESKEVAYQALAVQTGQQKHVAEVTAQRGLKANAENVTAVEGISALLLEVVDIDDPVEVGAKTAYEIRVTNQGSKEATNVVIQALVPDEMAIQGGQGPTKYRATGKEIEFEPLPKLAPRADAIYRVFVNATGVGDLRFRARLLSDSLTEPVIEEESTKVYAD